MYDFQDMPTDTRDLVKYDVDFPRLKNDQESGSPVSTERLVERLELHNLGVAPETLEFLRTAQVNTKNYWIWRFTANGTPHYATVCLRANGDITLGYEENYGGWTPEQYLLGDYHDFFYDHWQQDYTVRYPPDHPAFEGLTG